MSDPAVNVQTRLVKGSDIGVGRRVRILSGRWAGSEGTVTDLNPLDRPWSHFVSDEPKGWGLGWFRPEDLEPLDQGEK